VKIEVHGRTDQLRYRQLPLPRHGQAELFRAAYGPTVRAFESLDEDGRAAWPPISPRTGPLAAPGTFT
jgi:hypothetical protein